MSVAPEIARLAEAILFVPAQPAASSQSPRSTQGTAGPQRTEGAQSHDAAPRQLTLGTLARQLRMLAAAPERWWGLVRFDPRRSVKIRVEEHPSYEAWLVILPPGDTGQDCDCDVATIIAGQATEGTATSAVLRPGPTRVHGQRHRLRGHGASYSISLHARAHRSARKN